jgi:NAD(P)-dependent dehydrogenase (short-subunit alcohol dehydrogenase family)
MLPTPPPTAINDGSKLIIAITGANGMVGQGVTEKALADGHKVIALDMGPTSLRSDNKSTTSQPKARGEGERDEKDEKDEKDGEERYKYHQLDATDYDAYHTIVKEEGCTAIIHLAATFNKFGEDGELTSNVHSHVSLHSIQGHYHPYPLLDEWIMISIIYNRRAGGEERYSYPPTYVIHH